jgi:hypothetical protein
MRKEYSRNKHITIYGTPKEIAEAETVLDTLDGLEGEKIGIHLWGEGKIRLKIQKAIDDCKIKARILVDRNTVYPYKSIVNQYDRLKKSGKLENMTNAFYDFLMIFDIAHYNKRCYIAYYGNDFACMKKEVLDNACTPEWRTDVQRILDYIQGEGNRVITTI